MEEKPSNRREFLRGQAAGRALSHLVEKHLEGDEAPGAADSDTQPQQETYLLQFGRRAMACEFQVSLNAGQYDDAGPAVLAALDLVDELEQQMTVYRDDSEISALNRRAAGEPVAVEPRLFDLLKRGVELFHETGGTFDLTAGPLSQAWGFSRRAGAIPTAEALAAALALVGSGLLELVDAEKTVRFAKPGMQINLGAIGKGYALDRCTESMLAAGVSDFIWHGGNSSVVARGSRAGGGSKQAGWVVGLSNPLRVGERLLEIRLMDRALATSGAAFQFFRHGGRRYGHILDPRTGWPAEGVFSATAIAPTAAEADALSTAFYVMGPSATEDFCRMRPHIAAILLFPSASGSSVEMARWNLAPGEVREVYG